MSFIEVSGDSHFPIQNLPYGVFSTKDNVSQKYVWISIEVNCIGETKNWCCNWNKNPGFVGY
jgi:hypothetical protein